MTLTPNAITQTSERGHFVVLFVVHESTRQPNGHFICPALMASVKRSLIGDGDICKKFLLRCALDAL